MEIYLSMNPDQNPERVRDKSMPSLSNLATNILVIFPNQLFQVKYMPFDINAFTKIFIVEEPVYFSYLPFNLLKLTFQRASMQYYFRYLLQKKLRVEYLNHKEKSIFWIDYLLQKHTDMILHYIDPVDHNLKKQIIDASHKKKFEVIEYENPSFLSKTSDLNTYINTLKNKKKFSQYNFYIWQRKRLQVLMGKDGKPIGGKYSYDKYNRKPLPNGNFNEFLKEQNIKYPHNQYNNQYIEEATKYCEKHFTNYYPQNYTPENIKWYPVTHLDAKKHFRIFLKYKLKYFGDYQDAVDYNNPFMFHSVISPQINNGLLSPAWILQKIIEYYDKHSNAQKKKILSSVEGFIRQLNWREYSRLLYVYAYDLIKKNYFNNQGKLSKQWYIGNTGILPIDLTIQSAFRYGYLHHINRLMIMCNFMNLCRIHPDEVYQWFMVFSLDSYDWVMINNVYSMGLYADGGVTTTKPYISSSNYIRKMTNFPKDDKWENIWDTLYYYFIYKNFHKLRGRGKIYQSHWENKRNKKDIIYNAKVYLASI